jgi:hypothetical protein
MAAATGQSVDDLARRLAWLEAVRLLERRIPLTARSASREARYAIADPFLRFHHAVVGPGIPAAERRTEDRILAAIRRKVDALAGAHTWKDLCREWVMRAGARGELSLRPDHVGASWGSRSVADVAAMEEDEGEFLLGDCQWAGNPPSPARLEELLDRAERILPRGRSWRLNLLGFSRTGWGQADAQAVQALVWRRGPNWEVVAARVLNLQDIDRDLVRWAHTPPAAEAGRDDIPV